MPSALLLREIAHYILNIDVDVDVDVGIDVDIDFDSGVLTWFWISCSSFALLLSFPGLSRIEAS